AWQFVAEPVVLAVTPAQALPDAELIIYGNNLRGGAAHISEVTFDSVSATILAETNVLVRVLLPRGPSKGNATLRITASTGAYAVLNNAVEYLEDANLTSVVPFSGQYGTRVTVTGTNLLLGGTRILSARLAGVEAVIASANNSHVVLLAGRGSGLAGSGPLLLISDSLASFTSDSSVFSYLDLGDVDSVVPSRGVSGAVVTLTGTNLLGGGSSLTSVTFGSSSATVLSATSTRVVVQTSLAPALTPVDLTLVADTGAEITQSRGFQFVALPVISSIVPTSGNRGTRVTIQGQRLLLGAEALHSVGFNISGASATILSASASELVVQLAETVAEQAAQLVLTSIDNATVTTNATLDFVAPAVVEEVEPTMVYAGTLVT
ncbi:uncharacterized protein MONBRDRAFT_13240, partial [Monosiga brevicollis MX1]